MSIKGIVGTCGAILLFSTVINVVITINDANASPSGPGFFTGTETAGRGVFRDIRICGNMDKRYQEVLCPNATGYAVPNYSGSMNGGKQGFIDFIRGKLGSGSEHDRLGAAFIVFTMIGYSSSVGHRTPTGAELADWEARINNPAITIHNQVVTANPNTFYGQFTTGGASDIAYDWVDTTAESLVFRHNGSDVYYLKRNCANPLGRMFLPEAPSWTVTGHSEVNGGGGWTTSQINTIPGQTINWRHTLTNNSSSNMNRDVEWYVNPFIDGTIQPSVQGGTGRGNAGNTFVTRNASYTIQPGDVGRTICQDISWNPMTHSNGAWGHSNQACVYVPYDYSLMPRIIVPTSIPEGEPTIPGGSISPSVSNEGATRSQDAKAAVVRFVVRNNSTAMAAGSDGLSTTAPNWSEDIARGIGLRNGVTASSIAELWRTDATGEIGRGNNLNIPSLPDDDISSLSLVLGDQLCYATMVSNYAYGVDSNTFRYAVQCVRLAKRPKVQFWGADVRSNGEIITGTTSRGSDTFGSWAEYGLFSEDDILSASGAGLSGQHGRMAPLNIGRLTFANTPGPGHYGGVPQTTIPLLFTSPGGSSLPSGSQSIANLAAGGSRVEWSTGNLTITGGEVPLGKTIIVKSTGTVTISDDVRYANGSIADTAQLPQLVIVAQNIIITDAALRVDAWLIARGGYVSTCNAVSGTWTDGLSSNACNAAPLQINGPIIADHLYLRRTGGSDGASPNAPAEVLNLRPDTYLWAYGQTRNTTSIKTMYVRELPPRF